MLTEGIEDGLTVACAAPERRVAATVTLGKLSLIALPEAVTEVIVCADNDTHPQAIASLDRGLDHLRRLGKRVKVARIGRPVGDRNA